VCVVLCLSLHGLFGVPLASRGRGEGEGRGEWEGLVQEGHGPALGKVGGRVALPPQDPLGGQETLQTHGAPGVDPSRADAHLCP